MAFDLTSFGTGSTPKRDFSQILENFRAIKEDGISNAGTLGGKTLAEVYGYVDAANATLLGGAPEALLNTIYELANAINNDPDYAVTTLAMIGAKANSTDVYTKTAADARFAPGGYGLGGVSRIISTEDLNSIRECGFYSGHSIIHAPDAGFWHIFVNSHNDKNWLYQEATALGSGNSYATGTRLMRSLSNEVIWSPWRQLATTDSPVFSGDVGIGTTPVKIFGDRKTLHLSDAINNASIRVTGYGVDSLFEAVSGNTYISSSGYQSKMVFCTGTDSTEHMRLNHLGYLGIGTADPKANLDIVGSTILGGLGGATYLGWSAIGNSQLSFFIDETSYKIRVDFKTSDGTQVSRYISATE